MDGTTPTPTTGTDSNERQIQLEYENEIWTFYGEECAEVFSRIKNAHDAGNDPWKAAKKYARELGYQPIPVDNENQN